MNKIKCFLYTHSVPTPTVMSTTRDMHNYYGVMMTASHNPYYFNGIKVFTYGGYDADVNFTSLVEKKIGEVTKIKTLNERAARKTGLLEDFNNLGSYLSHIKSKDSENSESSYNSFLCIISADCPDYSVNSTWTISYYYRLFHHFSDNGYF